MAATIAYVRGSAVPTPKRSDDIRRLRAKAAARPHAAPIAASRNPWRTNMAVSGVTATDKAGNSASHSISVLGVKTGKP
jgi:hypothetical protein